MAKDSEVLDGTQEEATSEGSSVQAGQRSSVASDADVAKQLSDLQKKFDQLTRQLQSGKDRAIKQTNQRLDALEGDIRTVLQTALRDGKNVGDLLSDLEEAEERETRQMLREFVVSAREGRLPAAPGRQPERKGVDVSEVLEDLELDPNDTRVAAFRTQEFGSKEEAYREAAKLLKKIQTVQPSDADRASDPARTRQPATKQEELMREYQEGSKNLYGRQLMLYKQQMRQKGLEIS